MTGQRSAEAVRTPARLLVIYDEQCALCVRCRHWLQHEPAFVGLSFLPAGSFEARARFQQPLPWVGRELVVVSESGDAWIGPAAFLMALWATRRYREWAYRLSGPALAPMASRFFDAVSANRGTIAGVLGVDECFDGRCR